MKLKHLKNTLILFLLLITIQPPANACSCYPYEPVFCRNIYEGGGNIIRGVVTGQPEFYLMNFKVIENIHNGTIQDTIVIYGQDGLSCGEYLEQFNINDTLILAVDSVMWSGVNYWYLEGLCGLHFLRYEDGLVTGQITDSLTVQPIQSFRDNLFTCLELLLPLEEADDFDNKISLFPNPVLEKFQVSIAQDEIEGYEVYDVSGRQILNEVISRPRGEIEIASNAFGSGIYYIRIKTSKGILTRKFLKI